MSFWSTSRQQIDQDNRKHIYQSDVKRLTCTKKFDHIVLFVILVDQIDKKWIWINYLYSTLSLCCNGWFLGIFLEVRQQRYEWARRHFQHLEIWTRGPSLSIFNILVVLLACVLHCVMCRTQKSYISYIKSHLSPPQKP